MALPTRSIRCSTRLFNTKTTVEFRAMGETNRDVINFEIEELRAGRYS